MLKAGVTFPPSFLPYEGVCVRACVHVVVAMGVGEGENPALIISIASFTVGVKIL